MDAPTRPNLMGSPVAHATGMLGAVLGPLGRGGDIHLIDRWDPGHALEVMGAYDIGGGTGASIFLSTLLDHPDFTPAHAANMERIGLGGAPVPVELGRRSEALGIKIIRAYGSTEHPSTTGSQFADPAEQRHTTDGPALPGVELRLVDPIGVDVAHRCRRRDPVARARALPRLHQPAAQRRVRRRGLVPHRRHRGARRARLPDDHRPSEGHHHPRWREPVGGRDRERDQRRRRHRRGRRRRRPRRPARRARLRRRAHVARRRSDRTRRPAPASGAGRLARQKWPEELRVVTDFPRTASGKVRKVDLRADLRADS